MATKMMRIPGTLMRWLRKRTSPGASDSRANKDATTSIELQLPSMATSATPKELLDLLVRAKRSGNLEEMHNLLKYTVQRFPEERDVVAFVLQNINFTDGETLKTALNSARTMLSETSTDEELAVLAAGAAGRPFVRTTDRQFLETTCDAILARNGASAFWRAQRMMRKGDKDGAARELDAHLANHPDDLRELRFRIRIAAMQGKWGRDAHLFLRAERRPRKWPRLVKKAADIRAFFHLQGMAISDATNGLSPAANLESPTDVVRAVCSLKPQPYEAADGGILMFAESLHPGGAEKILASIFSGLTQNTTHRTNLCLVANPISSFHDPLYCLKTTNPALQNSVDFLDTPRPEAKDPYFAALPLQWDRMAQNIYEKIVALKPSAVYASLDYINIVTALAALRAGVPRIVLHIHNIRTTSILKNPGIEESFSQCYRLLADRAEVRLVACSDAVAEDFRKWCDLEPRHKITTIYNGYLFPKEDKSLPAHRAEHRHTYGLPANGPIVGTAMRISWVKRPDRWIETARLVATQNPSVHFAIFGDGDLVDQMRERAREEGIADRVTFIDWVPDIHTAMNCLDVFMLSSASEGFGNVLVEAQACGVPPVAYDVGGCRETMIPDVTGKIVLEDTAEALASAVLSVLNDHEWRATASKVGRAFVREKFREDRLVQQIYSALTESSNTGSQSVSGPAKQQISGLLEKGRAHIKQGELEQAAELAQRAHELAPKRPGPILLLARIAELRDGPQSKIEVIERFLHKVSDDIPLRRALAQTYFQIGQLETAQAIAENLAVRGTRNFLEHMILGRCALAAGDLDQANYHAKHARNLAPKRLGPALLAAQIAGKIAGPQKKLDLLIAYRETGGDHISVLRHLARAYFQVGEFEKSRALVAEIRTKGHDSFKESLLLGKIALQEGRSGEASQFAEAARAMAPDKPGPVRLLARIAELEGGVEAKTAVLSQYVDDVSDSFSLKLSLASALKNQNRFGEAVAVSESIDLAACNDHELFRLSGLFEMCSRPDLAKRCYSIINPAGTYGSALLLSSVLNRTITCKEALTQHAQMGLAKDNFYYGLLSFCQKQSLLENKTGDSAPHGRTQNLFKPYQTAVGYCVHEQAMGDCDAPMVSIVAPIHRVDDEDNLLRQMIRQTYPNLDAVVIINGPSLDEERIRSKLKESGKFRCIQIEVLPSDASLPASLNCGLSKANGAYIVRFDADDIYMENYISGTIGFMRSLSADVCTRPHIVINFEELGCNILYTVTDFAYSPIPNTHRPHGSGSSLAMSRSVAEKIKFDESLHCGEDYNYYDRCFTEGFSFSYAPPFDHIVRRREDKAAHTWKLGDIRLLQRSQNGFFLSQGNLSELQEQMAHFLANNFSPEHDLSFEKI